MRPTRLPGTVRAGVVVLLVLLLAAIGGATAAIRYGASALDVGGGFVVSSSWGPGDRWAGIEIGNPTGTPITLRGVTVREGLNIDVLDARVTGPRGVHLLLSREPLQPDERAALDGSKPLDGFVLPPHSREQYQIVVRLRPRSVGQAVMGRVAIVYSVWGLDHGVVSSGVYCVRAPGTDSCPPFSAA